MTYKILVVDDEPQIHTFIRISLTAEGYSYVGAQSIGEAKSIFNQQRPEVIILDLGLPDGDGIDFLNYVRHSSKTPVLILTARDQEDEKIRLLDAGANDYLIKPFGVRELIARIKVLVRDLVINEPVTDVIKHGPLRLQKSTHQFWLNGNELALTKKEFAFIEILLAQPGNLVKQEVLLKGIWGPSHQEDTHYLRIMVSQLRKKLNNTVEQPFIKTEAGLGYRLNIVTDPDQQ